MLPLYLYVYTFESLRLLHLYVISVCLYAFDMKLPRAVPHLVRVACIDNFEEEIQIIFV